MALDSSLNYWIARSGQTYGPYTADEVQRYLDAGNIAANDQLRSERDVEWTTVAASVSAPPAASAVAAPTIVTGDENARPLAVTSLVLGIVGIFTLFCVPVVLNIAGLVLAILALSRNDPASRSTANMSVVINLIGLVCGIGGIIADFAFLVAMSNAANGGGGP